MLPRGVIGSAPQNEFEILGPLRLFLVQSEAYNCIFDKFEKKIGGEGAGVFSGKFPHPSTSPHYRLNPDLLYVQVTGTSFA